MLSELSQSNPDLVLMNGDFIAHDVSVSGTLTSDQIAQHYAKLKEIYSDLFINYLSPMFPNSIFIPTLGNNDAKFHYGFPTTTADKIDYYGYISDMFFN